MTDSDKIVKIIITGLEVNEIIDSSLHTICTDCGKEGNVILRKMSYYHRKQTNPYY